LDRCKEVSDADVRSSGFWIKYHFKVSFPFFGNIECNFAGSAEKVSENHLHFKVLEPIKKIFKLFNLLLDFL